MTLANSCRFPQRDAVPPLVFALLYHLPPPGAAFPRAKRESWLMAMRLNLDLEYGPATEEMFYERAE